MSDFKAKMHQIRFRLGLRPRPCWRSLQRSPDPLAGFKGPTSNGRGGEGREWERKGEGRGGKEVKWEGGAPSARRAQGPQNTLRRLCACHHQPICLYVCFYRQQSFKAFVWHLCRLFGSILIIQNKVLPVKYFKISTVLYFQNKNTIFKIIFCRSLALIMSSSGTPAVAVILKSSQITNCSL